MNVAIAPNSKKYNQAIAPNSKKYNQAIAHNFSLVRWRSPPYPYREASYA
ncbi:hypothetical protein [Nostoc sp. CHAB 5715]|nr:hypothetical protein [Nostoc sp. CHAB 5715]MCC5621505.1 hypothetical protein [Nostoc sp. CHAB 5715]